MPNLRRAFDKFLSKRESGTLLLIVFTLLTGGLFKLSAFAREAFIASKFGLSTATDAYFALQQLPLTVATFMFGSFALAFTPVYANAHRRGDTAWLAGMLFYAVSAGLLLTGSMLLAAPLLQALFVPSGDQKTFASLAILTLCFVPVICIGIFAAICTAQGHNLRAMSMTGLPYLVMTLVLLALFAAQSLNELSLPLSMAAGFGLIGVYSFLRILPETRTTPARVIRILTPWRHPEFRFLLRQLTASTAENAGFAANQLLMLFFFARAGAGMVSANNCAMRIGMLGYGLLAQPLAQLVQARLCVADAQQRPELFRRWLLTVALSVSLLALTLFASRNTVIRAVYMHGKFKSTQLEQVAKILPAWIAYFVVMSLNAIVARYLFISSQGTLYVRRMLCAYAAANLLRFAAYDKLAAPAIIWCSVAAEGCAFALNLRSSLARHPSRGVRPALAAAAASIGGFAS